MKNTPVDQKLLKRIDLDFGERTIDSARWKRLSVIADNTRLFVIIVAAVSFTVNVLRRTLGKRIRRSFQLYPASPLTRRLAPPLVS